MIFSVASIKAATEKNSTESLVNIIRNTRSKEPLIHGNFSVTFVLMNIPKKNVLIQTK